MISSQKISILFKVVFLITLLLVIDYFLGNALKYYYFKMKRGVPYRTTYAIERTTDNILVFGSSRASHHYNSIVIQNILNTSCYNAGRDGNFIFYHLAVLKAVLKRYIPKIIILDFSKREFEKKQESYDRLSALLPYYQNHPEMRDIIALRGPFEQIKLLSLVYPYNSLLFTIAGGNNFRISNSTDDIKGYLPLTKILDTTIKDDTSPIDYQIDDLKVNAFELFLKDCINSKVKLYIICSPVFLKYNTDKSIDLARKIAKQYNIEFIDFSQMPLFANNSKLFSDIAHLNNEGATIFSSLVCDKLNSGTSNYSLH